MDTNLDSSLVGLHLDGSRFPHSKVFHVHQLAISAIDAPRGITSRRMLSLKPNNH